MIRFYAEITDDVVMAGNVFQPRVVLYCEINPVGSSPGGGVTDYNDLENLPDLSNLATTAELQAVEGMIPPSVAPFNHVSSVQVNLSKPNGITQILLTDNAIFSLLTNPAPVHGYINCYDIACDGNTPDLSAFTKEGTDDIVTTAGYINHVAFYYWFGKARYIVDSSEVGVLDDNDPPTLSSLSISDITQIQARINGTSNKSATLFWAVYANDSAAPTDTQIENGTGAISHGSEVMTANVTVQDILTNLVYSTPYDVWYYAVGANGVKSDPAKLDFSTIARTQLTAPVITLQSAGQTQMNYSIPANLHGVNIYRALTAGGSRTLYETLSAGTLLGTPITGLTQGTDVYLYSEALGNLTTSVNSPLSVEYTGQTSNIIQLTAPTAGTPIVNTDTAITVPITGVDPNTSFLRPRHKRNIDGVWINATSTLAANSTQYQYTGLTSGVLYDFDCIALGDGSNYSDSNASNTVQATTKTAAPTLIGTPATSTDGFTVEFPFSRAMAPNPDPSLLDFDPDRFVFLALKSGDATKIIATVTVAFDSAISIAANISAGFMPADEGMPFAGVTGQAVTNNVSVAIYSDDFAGTVIDTTNLTVTDPVDSVTISQNNGLYFSINRALGLVASTNTNRVDFVPTIDNGCIQLTIGGTATTASGTLAISLSNAFGTLATAQILSVSANDAQLRIYDNGVSSDVVVAGGLKATWRIRYDQSLTTVFWERLVSADNWVIERQYVIDLGTGLKARIGVNAQSGSGITNWIISNFHITNDNYSTSNP